MSDDERRDIRAEWFAANRERRDRRAVFFGEVDAVSAHETGMGWDPTVLLPAPFWKVNLTDLREAAAKWPPVFEDVPE